MSNGGYVIAYNNNDANAPYVILNFCDADGNVIGNFKIPYDTGTSAIGKPTITQLANGNVLVVWDENANQALAFLGPGSFVGEIALLLAEPRSASLKVAIDADLYVLAKDAFDQLIANRPEIALYMTRELSQRLVKTSQRRFQPRARRISALWGSDNGVLARTLGQYVSKSIAVLPLGMDVQLPPNSTDVTLLKRDNLSVENIAGTLSQLIETFSHIVMLVPPPPPPPPTPPTPPPHTERKSKRQTSRHTPLSSMQGSPCAKKKKKKTHKTKVDK